MARFFMLPGQLVTVTRLIGVEAVMPLVVCVQHTRRAQRGPWRGRDGQT